MEHTRLKADIIPVLHLNHITNESDRIRELMCNYQLKIPSLKSKIRFKENQSTVAYENRNLGCAVQWLSMESPMTAEAARHGSI